MEPVKGARGHGDMGAWAHTRGPEAKRLGGSDRITSWQVDKLTRGQGRPARGQERGSAKVQIGAELLCKSAKVAYKSIEYGVLSMGRGTVSGGRWREDFHEAGSGQRQDIAVLLVGARRCRDRGVRADAYADASLPRCQESGEAREARATESLKVIRATKRRTDQSASTALCDFNHGGRGWLSHGTQPLVRSHRDQPKAPKETAWKVPEVKGDDNFGPCLVSTQKDMRIRRIVHRWQSNQVR